MLRSIGPVTVLALLMVGCGGGGGGVVPTPPPPPPPANYTVGGTVTGLTGSGLVLLFHDSNLSGPHPVSLPVSTNMFTFSPAVPQGGTYTVSVGTQPESPAQNCVVTNGTGVVGAGNVTSVKVVCSNAPSYAVAGTVSGLVGSGLALEICRFQSNGYGSHGGHYDCDSPVPVSASGAFTLGGSYPATYSGPDLVMVAQQPTSPTQRCVVGNATISIHNANDTSVTVSCAEYAYVTNAADNTVSAYAIDAATGALTVVGAPISTGASPSAIAGTANKRLMFVANEGTNDVSAFTVDPTTGGLTDVPGSPFAAGVNPQAMTVIEALSGPEYLLVANGGSDNFSAFDIDATGALAHRSIPATPFPTGQGPTSIAIRPGGGLFIYVANHGGSNDISAFGDSLAPVPGSPYSAGGNPLSLAFGAGGSGGFLYTANPDAAHPTISGFSMDPNTGALSALNGPPFSIPVSHYIATDQAGAYLYVTSGASVLGYAIDATTGALTALPGFPVAAGANAYSISIDPTNQFLYVANDGAASISGFRLNAATGALTPMAGSPFPAGNHPEFIAAF